ncbi:MAG: acyltransferase, partial [Bacteroides sp.]
GIYMIHYFFTGPSVVVMRYLDVPLGLQIPIASVIAFGISWLLVWLIYRCMGKKAKWLVG